MQTIKTMPSKPSKQRKMIYKAPDHIRQKLLAAPLSPELKATHKVRSLPVRSGDTVRITRGDHKGFEGKVTRVDRNAYRIYVEGLTREKVDGTTIFVPIHPSKVMITKINLDDKWRKKILKRKKGVLEKVKVAEKPPEKVVGEIIEPEKEVAEEKLPEKPKPKRRVKTPKKTATKKTKKETAKEEAQKKEKQRKTGTKRKSAKKIEGET
jgi:large subunit ribosomal protein L24